MVHRYICEIHDEIDRAVKVGRIDLIKGLTEEARTAGKRMEAKLQEYAELKYDISRAKELKERRRQLSRQIVKLERCLPEDLDDTSGEEDEVDWDELMSDD